MLARLNALFLLLLLASLAIFEPEAQTVRAGFTLVGIVDGGKPSGATLSPDGALTIVSDDSGAPMRYVISLAWIKDRLPDIAQDDLLSIEVEVLPDGTLVATSISNLSDREGTVNDGLSTGSRRVREQPRQPAGSDASNDGPPTATTTPDSTPTPTAVTTTTVSSTPSSTVSSTPTDTAAATPSATATPTVTSTPAATSTPTVTLTPVPPVAVDDSTTVFEDSGANAVAVLTNDTGSGPKSIASVTQPASGTVTITGGGTGVSYAPNTNYCNAPPSAMLDTFTYTLVPGGSTATVSVTVTCVDDNPVANADSPTVTEDAGPTAIDVLGNDTDVDGGPISITSVTQPAHGTVVITGGGTGLTYEFNAPDCTLLTGPVTFTYTLTPGGSTATVSVTVFCVA
ncbi:MAG: cadherin-like domain-containing protein [Chloroflexi bacterium]|nr:cadherin-like domain-containing protein [Chloroflexota bacterium]